MFNFDVKKYVPSGLGDGMNPEGEDGDEDGPRDTGPGISFIKTFKTLAKL